MRTAIAALVAVLMLSMPAAYGAEAKKREVKTRLKASHKTPAPEKLFADTKKHLAVQAAKTAETIRANWATLKKTISSEPQTTGLKAKTAHRKEAAKANTH